MRINRPLRISPSSINTFLKCSMQFKWRYIDELEPDEETDNLYAPRGITFHKLMQLNDLYSLDEKKLKNYWEVVFLSYVSDCSNLPKDLSYDSFLKSGDLLIENGLNLKKRWEDAEIIENEDYIRLEYKNKFIDNLFLSGRLDLVLLKDDDYIVLDWKTSKSIEKNIGENLQIGLYIYFIHKKYKIDYENIFGALAYPFSKKILFTQRDENSIQEIFNKIDKMLERLSNSDFKKEPKENWNLDNCYFCPYIKNCDKRNDD